MTTATHATEPVLVERAVLTNVRPAPYGKVRAICRFCNEASRPARADRDGEPDMFELGAGWSCAPYPASYVHEDGTKGSLWCCPSCNRRLYAGESLRERQAAVTAAKHAPGPWSIDLRWSKPHYASINAPTHSALASVVWCMDGDQQTPQCEANARLIAAAPDLLALAHKYASECAECGGTGVIRATTSGCSDYPCYDCADIRAVIAKAEGRA